MADSRIHPATTVTNIKTAIPITLDLESGQYNNWATLFKLHARANLVLEHIIPTPTDAANPKPSSSTEPAVDKALWKRIDAIVTQWIYSTVSFDILNTIIDPDDEAKDAWNRVADLFQDNKTTRVVHLESKFATTHLRDFPNVAAYCQQLKVLADQLANVGAKVSDERMVLRLIGGLTEAYAGFVTVVQHRTPLPTFAQARSMLSLEEESMKQRAALESGSDSALIVNSNTNDVSGNNNQQKRGENKSGHHNSGNQNYGGHGGRGGGRGNNCGGRGGRGGNRGGGRGGGHQQHSPSAKQAFQETNSYSRPASTISSCSKPFCQIFT